MAPDPKVSCPICHDDDGVSEWVTTKCGHTFHKDCLDKCMVLKRDCPSCRTSLAQRNGQAVFKLFVSREDEGGGAAMRAEDEGEPADDSAQPDWLRASRENLALTAEVTRLKSQLMRKEKANQDLVAAMQDESERAAAVAVQLQAAQLSRASAEAKVQEKIGEANALDRENKFLKAQESKLKLLLQQERQVSAKLQLQLDPSLVGEPLARCLKNLATTGLDPPAYFQSLVEERSRKASAATQRADRAEREKGIVEAELRRMEQRLEAMRRQLEEAQAARAGAHSAERGSALDTVEAVLGSWPARQSMAGLAAAAGAAAAPIRHDGPLSFRSAHGFRSSVARTVKRPAPRQSSRAPDAANGAAAAPAGVPAAAPPPPVLQARHDDDDLVSLDGSEEQEEGAHSEVDSDDDDDDDDDGLPSWHLAHPENEPTAANVPPDRSLLGAGLSLAANLAAPGPSFMRDPQRATTGLQDGGQYIQHVPDGRGGVTCVYKSGGGGRGGGGWASQPAARKRRKGGRPAAAAAGAELRISHYFSKGPTAP